MNGIEKITTRILEDSEREIAAIEAEAKEQAEAIATGYEERARREAEEILSHGTHLANERETNLGSMAQMEAKKSFLAAKQKMIGRAFDMAVKELRGLPGEDYIKLLSKLAAKATRSYQEEIILSPKDREALGEDIVAAANKILGKKGKLTLSERTRQINGGLILSDGEMEVNCSFETLVRLQENEMAGEVANILFQ